MPQYQELIFGCSNMRAGLAERNRMSEAEMLWEWISRVSENARISLDWPDSTIIIGAMEGEVEHQDDVFGIVVAISDDHPRQLHRPAPSLGRLLPENPTSSEFATLCMPLSVDIQTAMMQWEIVRLAARGIGLDLPPGRLLLVQGI